MRLRVLLFALVAAECPLTARLLLSERCVKLCVNETSSSRRPCELDFCRGMGREIGMLAVRWYAGFTGAGSMV